MPRFFFHVENGGQRDEEGTFFGDVKEARAQALAAASDLLKEAVRDIAASPRWSMTITDEAGHVVGTIRFSFE